MPLNEAMPDAPGMWSRAWTSIGSGLMACGRSIPVLLTTATAFFSSLTALGVYQGEQNRQQFERMKHAYEVYRDYGAYLDNHPSALPCMEVLTRLAPSDLVNVMRYAETAGFRYDPARHGALTVCLDGARRRQPASADDWTVEDTRYVRFKMLSQIGALDTALLSFYNDIGDRGVICDNFRGLFLVGTIKEFYAAVMHAGVVHGGNYPNVKGFAELVASGQSCPKTEVVDRQRIELLDRYKALLLRAAGEAGR